MDTANPPTVRMTPDIAARLRAPFRPEEIGKLPRISCPRCRDSSGKVCPEHTKGRCTDCRNWITSAHLHLDYVGHAEITDRFLQVDPGWTWEPFAHTPEGLPAFDNTGGLWIRLTIAGVTRIGYGDAGGKRGTDAVKETIGDALRNAGMRFGSGLDMWGSTFDPDHGDARETPSAAAPPPVISDQMRGTIFGLWKDLGFTEGTEEQRVERLLRTCAILDLPELESTSDLSPEQGQRLIKALRERRDYLRQQARTEGIK